MYLFRRAIGKTRPWNVRLRVRFHDWILKSKKGYCVSLITDQSGITRTMADQIKGRRIHSGEGLLCPFDAPWSKWSWIDLFNKETQNRFSDFRIQS